MHKGLTTFRGLTFFSIFFFHCYVFEAGDLAVQGFFVLSGFLLTEILIKMKDEFQGKNYFVNFYARRAIRIFPLYYTYLLLVVLLTVPFLFLEKNTATPKINLFYDQWPWVFTYTYNFFHATDMYKHNPIIVHFWSLAVEEQFYLIWPIAMYAVPIRHVRTFLILVMIASPLWRYVLGELLSQQLIPYAGKDMDLVIYVLPFSHFDAFAAGGYFALYGRTASAGRVWTFLAFLIAAGLISSWFATGKWHAFSFGYQGFMHHAYQYVWGYTLANFFFAYLLVALRNDAFLPSIFNNSVLHYFGEISYGMYVFHYPIIWLTGLWLPNTHGLIRIVIALTLTILLGSMSYFMLEKRVMALKYKYFPRRS